MVMDVAYRKVICKYFGCLFKIRTFNEYKDRYGRVQTKYADFEGGRVDLSNVELKERSIPDAVMNEFKERSERYFA